MIKSNHLSLDVQSHLPPISPPCRSPMEGNVPSARYTKLSELLRKATTSQLQCSMFCGGRKCKYESEKNWADEEKALPALYSHWVTEDILAMARPNNEIIKQFNLIRLFKENGIKTIFNLQEPGEHGSCGPPLDSSGFSYDPKLFMENQIYFYNFHWKDFSGVSESALLDMVKVMTFALSQGKIAIHCHAGLGRTGVLIAGYLIYTYRCQAHSAIMFVRMRRPNSIQSRSQILSLFKFANFISPCFIVYKSVSSKQISNFNLSDFLLRQRTLLHGEELRSLKFIPKVLFIICEKLIKMSGKTSILRCQDGDCENSGDGGVDNFTRHYLSNRKTQVAPVLAEENESESTGDSNDDDDSMSRSFDPDYNLQYEIDHFDLDPEKENIDEKLLIDSLADAEGEQTAVEVEFLKPEILAKHRPSFEVLQQSLLNYSDRTAPPEVIITVLTSEPKTETHFSNVIYNYQKAINNTPNGWQQLCEENDLEILTVLLWSWFENLDSPILNNEYIGLIVEHKEDVSKSFFSMDAETRFTLEYLLRFVMRLVDDQAEDSKRRLVTRLVAALTIKRVQLTEDSESIPRQKSTWMLLSSRSRDALFNFLHALMQLIASEAPI